MIHHLLLILLFATQIQTALSWGKDGHTLTARIAQSLLNEDALSLVKRLLPAELGDIGSIASWADDERAHMLWSSHLHYINTPDWQCNYNRQTDCPVQRDITGQSICQQTQQEQQQKQQAIQFTTAANYQPVKQQQFQQQVEAELQLLNRELLFQHADSDKQLNSVAGSLNAAASPSPSPSQSSSSFQWRCYDCVDGAIQNYTLRLLDSDLPFEQRQEALKFLTHFIGDIHQPLHVSFEHDQGGNKITGTFLQHHSNLHAIWDERIITHRMARDFQNDYTAYEQYMIQRVKTGDYNHLIQDWQTCDDNHLKQHDDLTSNTDKSLQDSSQSDRVVLPSGLIESIELTSQIAIEMLQSSDMPIFNDRRISHSLSLSRRVQCNRDPSCVVCSDQWAKESAGKACNFAYVKNAARQPITTPFQLYEDYYEFALPTVELQLAKGGVRLANTLNFIAETNNQQQEIPSPPFNHVSDAGLVQS